MYISTDSWENQLSLMKLTKYNYLAGVSEVRNLPDTSCTRKSACDSPQTVSAIIQMDVKSASPSFDIYSPLKRLFVQARLPQLESLKILKNVLIKYKNDQIIQ